MTEGILMREMMADPLLRSYSVIMLDEVHERTLFTDILMGLLKKILRKQKKLRLIVTSATMDAEHLCNFFNQSTEKDKKSAVIMSVEGKLHPVQVHFLKVSFCINTPAEMILPRLESSLELLDWIASQEPCNISLDVLH
ncbi:ATPdependent RNA helicase [Homalodisca vitripennis]|nr:ATPdependent RNA helicase [Homalodisca vitripennis]